MRTRFPLPALLLLAAVASAAAPRMLPPTTTPARNPPGSPPRVVVLPRLVFASRALPRQSGAIPGLGPSGRTLAPGGELEVRETDGRVHPLLAHPPFVDVSDPAVSWDGRFVAFAAMGPDSGAAWRIWLVGADGRGLSPVTRSDRTLDTSLFGAAAERFERYDDLDPCWLPDGRLCFSSTRFPELSQQGVPATNLYVVQRDGSELRRITAERNGAEEPCVDPRNGRVVYARWWFNRYRASDEDASGLTLDPARALPADTVDLWQAVSILPDGSGLRLAGGDPRSRASQMAYQPLVLEDGTLVGVGSERRSLVESSGAPCVQAFAGGFAAATRLTPPSARACSPAALADGRVLLSMDPSGGDGFALYVVGRNGRGLTRVLGETHRALLDAVALAPRRRPPVIPTTLGEEPRLAPIRSASGLGANEQTFRFDCLNVFANAPVDAPFPDAPPMQSGVRIRFFAPLARPEVEGRDTVVLVRESAVTASGAVHVEDLPADTPLFEQLVDAQGHVLRSTGGPAHVAGMNFARLGSGTQCVGCHTGHSAIPVPVSAAEGQWTNASPSAVVSASSTWSRCAGARAVVDRRAKGPATTVGWIADSDSAEWIRLEWRSPIEVRAIVLYALTMNAREGTNLEVRRSEVVLTRAGRTVGRFPVSAVLAAGGTRIACEPVVADGLEFRVLQVSGSVRHHRSAGLAEIETVARLAATP
jgi:hypothetical protein